MELLVHSYCEYSRCLHASCAARTIGAVGVERGADLECLRPQVETLVRAATGNEARVDASDWCYLDGALVASVSRLTSPQLTD